MSDQDDRRVEVSFVMPCLNEERTLAACILAARGCIEANKLSAEVIVADNGSTDASREIATANGARVVPIEAKGYGHALMGGIQAARGRYIVMADADQSYDFGEAMKFIERLRAGADLVMGNRFAGKIMPGAMPVHHKYLGNPVLSWIGRVLFGAPVRDFHCGLRAFSKDAFTRMDVRTTGMEFASELVIKAQLRGMRLEQVPITLHKDGRNRPPHLRSFRDGWRHLRFMLTLSPRWTLFFPGAVVFAIGAALMLLTAFAPFSVAGVTLDLHTLVIGSLAMVVGYQFMATAAAMRAYALESHIGPAEGALRWLASWFTLERGLISGILLTLVGVGLVAYPVVMWVIRAMGDMDPSATLRPLVVGATLVAIGVQTCLMAIVVSMFSIHVRDRAL